MPAPATLRPIARRALAAQSDDRLVRLVREGHEPAFEEMVRRYRGPLVAFAAAIVSADGAEDVVQTSLAKAHQALLADSREIKLRPWLFAIVRNGSLNAIRGEPRVDELREAMATSAGPSEVAEQRDDLDRLVVAMCALPAAQRQALVKRELEGVGHGEIAAQLGTTATAVRGLIFRARSGLRDAVGVLVPLPLLRTLLTEAPSIGVAGGGAGAGAAALLGGGAAKGGTVIAAAVVAIGTGLAIDQGRKDGSSGGSGGATSVTRSVGVIGGSASDASSSTPGEAAPATGTGETNGGASRATGESPSGAAAGEGRVGGGDDFGSGPAVAVTDPAGDDPQGDSSGKPTDDSQIDDGTEHEPSGPGGPGDDHLGDGSSSSSGPGPGESGSGPSSGPSSSGGGSSGPGDLSSGTSGSSGASGGSSEHSDGSGSSETPPSPPPAEPDDDPPELVPPEGGGGHSGSGGGD